MDLDTNVGTMLLCVTLCPLINYMSKNSENPGSQRVKLFGFLRIIFEQEHLSEDLGYVSAHSTIHLWRELNISEASEKT